MKFDKLPLTFEQQADLLLSRGLIADQQTLVRWVLDCGKRRKTK